MTASAGVVESTEVDGVVLQIAQQPLTPWVLPAGGAGLLVLLLLGLAAPVPVTVALAVAGGVAVAVAGTWRTTLRLEVTPTRTRIVGWIGRFPLPDDRVFLTPGLRATVEPGVLRLDFAGEVVEARALRASPAALAHVRERIEQQRRLGDQVRGRAD